MKYSYGIAKLVMGTLEALSWAIIVLGLIGAGVFISEGDTSQMFNGLWLSAFGLIAIATIQMAMAQIATAENTSAMLELMQREHRSPRKKDRAEPPVTHSRTARPT